MESDNNFGTCVILGLQFCRISWYRLRITWGKSGESPRKITEISRINQFLRHLGAEKSFRKVVSTLPGPRNHAQSTYLIENEKLYWQILQKVFQKIFGSILVKNLWFLIIFRAWFELSSAFPGLFRRKMGAGNMKNGGGWTPATQNTQESLRITKTRKVMPPEPSVRPNCHTIQIPKNY